MLSTSSRVPGAARVGKGAEEPRDPKRLLPFLDLGRYPPIRKSDVVPQFYCGCTDRILQTNQTVVRDKYPIDNHHSFTRSSVDPCIHPAIGASVQRCSTLSDRSFMKVRHSRRCSGTTSQGWWHHPRIRIGHGEDVLCANELIGLRLAMI